jgi:hypothetical protein
MLMNLEIFIASEKISKQQPQDTNGIWQLALGLN